MAIAPMLRPLVLKNAIVEIGGTDYRRHVSNVTFTPSSSTLTWSGMSPDSQFSDAGSSTWTVAITMAQDWSLPNSLCRFLFENEGEVVDMTFAPVDGGPSFEAEVIVLPGSIGGAVNAVAESTVTLGLVGRPVLVPVVAGP